MKLFYTGEERRKAPLLELLTKRVLTLELAMQRQEEVLEVLGNHWVTEFNKLNSEISDLKAICRSCPCFGDDYK